LTPPIDPHDPDDFDGPVSPDEERAASDEASRREAGLEFNVFRGVRDVDGGPVLPVRLKHDDMFCFSCHKGVSCWNECCHGADVMLTPYDILRLSRDMEQLDPDTRAILNGHITWINSQGAKGERAILDGRDLNRVDFKSIDLSAASLRDVDFTGANLTDCTLVDANMMRVNFRPADILDSEGKPTGRTWAANLTDAIIDGAVFDGAELRKAIIPAAA